MSSIIDLIYSKINDVIGGSNPSQFFTLLLPGTILNPDDFGKPSIASDVLLRSSQLANGLFDLCQVTSDHNGRMLQDQYNVALSQLMPKLNPRVETMRGQLRDALQTTVDTTLPDGTKFTGKKIDLLNRLMGLYSKALNDWSATQNAQQDALKLKYPSDIDKRREEFNEWYKMNSTGPENNIRQAYAQTTFVLSPDESALIDGILDSGSNAINMAKDTLRRACQHFPDGDAYEVMFTPSDWPSLLTSDFGYIDLLDSPEHLADQIALQQGVIDAQLAQLDALSVMIPTDSDLQSAKKTAADAQDDYQKAQSAIIDVYADSAATAAKIYLSKKDQKQSADPVKALNEINDEVKKGSPNDSQGAQKKGGASTALTSDDVDKLLNGQKAVNAKQSALQSSSQKYASAALQLIADQSQYMNLKPYYTKLQEAAQQIAALQTKMAVASNRPDSTIQQIFPSSASQRFTQLQIDFASSTMSDSSSLASSFSQTSWSVDLFFGSASGSSSSASSKFAHDVISSSANISIGMLLAKVEIDRSWFRPGVFVSTADMATLSSKRISPGPLSPPDFAKAGDAVLPTFPTGFVIAKDITISLTTNDGTTHQAQNVLDKQESAGGGFLCFSVSHSSADHAESKAFSSFVQGNRVVIRIPGAQVIGWYQEFLPADQSTPISATDAGLNSFLAQFQAAKLQAPTLTRTFKRAA